MTNYDAQTLERLQKQAQAVYAHLDENPNVGIELDPELADFLGAFEEPAIDLDELADDAKVISVDEVMTLQ